MSCEMDRLAIESVLPIPVLVRAPSPDMPTMRVAPLLLALLFVASGASAQRLVGLTSCCPNEVVTVDAVTGDTTTVAAIGTASDGFIATVGSLVLDASGGRAYLVRNGLVTWIDLATGAVTEGRTASDWIQLAGVDAARGRLYAFATERDTLDTAEDQIFRNYLVAYDLATEDTTRLEQVGEYTIIDGIPSGDTFSTVTGPAVASGDALYTIRNGRLVSVDLASGAVAEGATDLELPEVVGTDGTWLYRTERAVTGPDTLRTYTGRLLRQPLAGGVDAVPDTVGVYALATISSGSSGPGIEGDVYLASFGVAYFDAVGDRVLLNRNGRLIEVPLGAPETVDLGPVGRIRYVPAPASVATASESPPEASLALRAAPNPASGAVIISLDAPEAARVEVLDALGRRVALLHDGPLAPDALTWDADVAPGVYFVRATTRSGVETVVVTLAR